MCWADSNRSGPLYQLAVSHLWRENFSGSIPIELGSLSNVILVFRHDCGLCGHMPSEIGCWTSMTRLYIFNSMQSGPITTTSVSTVALLVDLQCEGNRLRGIISSKLSNSVAIRIYGSQFSGGCASASL